MIQTPALNTGAGGTACGMLYALALRSRGRLFDAILAHAVTNGTLAVVAATTGRYELWL